MAVMSASGWAPVEDTGLLTSQLQQFGAGDREMAEAVLRRILPELHRIAIRELRRERTTAPLTPTELINETWLRSLHEGRWTISNRTHFYSIAALAMRHALVDYARRRLAQRRNADQEASLVMSSLTKAPQALSDPESIVLVGELMEQLEQWDKAAAEVADLHYVAGYTLEEIAQNTGLALRQVRYRWSKAKSWLERRLRS